MSLCAHCGFNNPTNMRFCGNCGARHMKDDALTPDPLPTSFKLPPDDIGIMVGADLAKRLRETGVDAKGQRRNVTVLFVDLTGYTSISGLMDDEDLYDFIHQYMQQMSKDVYKYEGIVDKLTGDGLMALFGAPISHENNAELAVRAALDMQHDMELINHDLMERFEIEIKARIGLHSGAVVVGGIGSDMMMDYTAIGDTVNLAHRIEEAAPAGAILISESVHRQVRGIFECKPISILTPKGVASPVQAYRVTGLNDHPDFIRGIEGLHAPMIGRDQELVRLKLMANRLIEDHVGQFVLVTGEAGIGKTRLIEELIAWIDPREIRILKGHSLAYRRTIPYLIIRNVIYSYLNLPESAPKSEISEQLVRNVTRALDLQAQRTLPFLENLLSIPHSDPIGGDLLKHLDPRQVRQQTFLAVRDLFVTEATARPLMFILDDLHWADEASLNLISFLLRDILDTPIFVLAISRTNQIAALEEAIQWAGQNLGGNFEHIELQNLSKNQSERLLALLLSIPCLPDEMREHILLRAAGIPFYLEEILRMLIDRGLIQQDNGQWHVMSDDDISSVGVPATLGELILTRFDRLDKTDKTVIQVAAVIGKDFDLAVLGGVLATLSRGHITTVINRLIQRDFIVPYNSSTGEKYTFRHILMSDAIYGTLLRKERRKLHAQVGDVIEELYSERLEEQVELLANHYRWSNKLDRAFHYIILAGQKASRNYLKQTSLSSI